MIGAVHSFIAGDPGVLSRTETSIRAVSAVSLCAVVGARRVPGCIYGFIMYVLAGAGLARSLVPYVGGIAARYERNAYVFALPVRYSERV